MAYSKIIMLALLSSELLTGCHKKSCTSTKLEAHRQVQGNVPDQGIPSHLDINGQTWNLVPVDHFDDNDVNGETDCENREIDYATSSDPAELREAIWHEIFHAGACVHGGDQWWNSVHPTDDVHPGIYHLADFMHNFTHDNKQFVSWAEEE
jgi:hypothetical protein